MRVHKKFLAVLLAVLLTAMAVIIPTSAVFAAATNFTVTLSGYSGPPNTVIYAYGTPATAFTAGATYTVYMNGAPATGTYSISSTSQIVSYFGIPVWPRGVYSVTITTSTTGDTQLAPWPTFTITPQIFLSSTSIKSGDVVTISGNGFAASTPITIYLDGVARTLASAVSSDYYGQFTGAQITIPPVSGGNHSITAGDLAGVSPGVTFAITSDMTLSANTAAVGGSITVSGTGFAASSALSFSLDSTAISSSASTDTAGNFSNVTVTIPSIAGGTHNFKVQDASGNSVTKSLAVTAAMTSSPATGPVDTTVGITGKGFLASTPMTFTFDGATISSLLSLSSGADGSINTSFKIPASSSGNHVVAVSDGTTTLNATFAISSTSAINVTSGPVGTSVTASGSGFKYKGNITVTYNNAQIGTATAGTNGSFTTTFAIPSSSTGPHSLVISDQTNTQTYTFTMTPTTNPMSPTTGYIGTSITISGTGYGASKAIIVTYDASPVTLTAPGTTDANGTFSVSFKAPVSKGGNHPVTVSDGTTTGTFTFAMDSTPPPVPALSLPLASTKLAKVPTFTWTAVTDPNGVTYNLQISKDISFNTLILQKTGLTTTSYTLNTQNPQEVLKSASKSAPYYWRVQAIDGASNTSAWTTPQTFLVGLALGDYAGYIILGVIAIMLGALGFVLGRLTRRRI
jgi:hypothetical protein